MTKKENWEKTNYPCRECAKSGKKVMAVGCFRPDLDMRGLCFCERHKEKVSMEYLTITSKAKI